MKDYEDRYIFVTSDRKESSRKDVINTLKKSKADMLLNYLPVGSEEATRFYVECALEAGVALINNVPVFIASDPEWAERFKTKNIPLIGDDIKAQIGATITHRVLTDLFKKRGVKLERTYQLNTGGNTDFLNMLNPKRLASKKLSKTEAVQSVTAKRLEDVNIHIGPSDYVPWQKDNKICFIRMEGKLFGNVPMNIELRLSVEDSPNSAGVAIDSIRCCKLALDRGIGGILYSPSAYFSKHPPKQFTDDKAHSMLEEFIANKRQN
jgi:myo-inositol-1-phosphate synthase